MQRQPCTGVVLIDQTGVGDEFFEACLRSRVRGQREERLRHWRPRQAALRVHRLVTIAGSVRHPTESAAIRHCNGHAKTARCDHVAEWGLGNHVADRRQDFRFLADGRSCAELLHPDQRALHSVRYSKDLRTGSLSWACHYVASWNMMPTV